MSASGFYDLQRHFNSQGHKDAVVRMRSYKPIGEHFLPKSKIVDSADEVTKAEFLFSAFVAEHDLPASVADHFTHLCNAMFPDSKIAKGSYFITVINFCAPLKLFLVFKRTKYE